MSDSPRIITGDAYCKALVDAGIVPPKTNRVVIEAVAGKAVVLHYRVFGDERLLAVVDELRTADVASVDDQAPDS